MSSLQITFDKSSAGARVALCSLGTLSFVGSLGETTAGSKFIGVATSWKTKSSDGLYSYCGAMDLRS